MKSTTVVVGLLLAVILTTTLAAAQYPGPYPGGQKRTAWYVVTFAGAPVAGPFALLSECQDMATYMSKRYGNVSQTCQNK